MPQPIGPTRRAAVITVAALLAGACGGPQAAVAPPLADRACTLVPPPGSPAESASVVFTWPIDPTNAPRASSLAERFVVAHAYETLLRVDCLRRPTSGLAKSWVPVNGNLRLVLRSDARFWNGDVVRASDVVASWRTTGRAASAALARRFADASTAVDDSTLDISMPGLSAVTLGDPELAVVRRSGQMRWPEGTGAYRLTTRGSTLVLLPVGNATPPRLTIHSATETDARDLIDTGVDLLLTDSPALATYAATRGDVASIPLAWHRTWVIVTPQRTPLAPDSVASLMTHTLAFRSALARDAVRADARPAEPPFWWGDSTGCLTGREGVAARGWGSSRVAYPRDEPVARALAERLVALAASSRSSSRDSALTLLAPALAEAGARATTVGLEPIAFWSALRNGSELAFVFPLDRASLTHCVDVRGAIAPLIDTRVTVVVRRDRLGLTVTWDSTVTISSARARERP
jgi:hypothetical protein